MEHVAVVNLSQQMSMRRSMDVIANNLANMNTTAFKAETMLFQEHLEPLKGAKHKQDPMVFAMDYGMSMNFQEGHFEPTANPMDVAISGDAFLVVETPQGERYTRNGHLRLDADGQIVTHDNHPVLSEDGQPIIVDLEDTNLTIAPDGSVNTGRLAEPVRLMVVAFENSADMIKDGSSLYKAAVPPQPAENFRIQQGMLERSNVSPIREMTKMIQTMQAYSSAAKMNENTADLSRKAIERLGRTQS